MGGYQYVSIGQSVFFPSAGLAVAGALCLGDQVGQEANAQIPHSDHLTIHTIFFLSLCFQVQSSLHARRAPEDPESRRALSTVEGQNPLLWAAVLLRRVRKRESAPLRETFHPRPRQLPGAGVDFFFLFFFPLPLPLPV